MKSVEIFPLHLSHRVEVRHDLKHDKLALKIEEEILSRVKYYTVCWLVRLLDYPSFFYNDQKLSRLLNDVAIHRKSSSVILQSLRCNNFDELHEAVYAERKSATRFGRIKAANGRLFAGFQP